MTVKPAPTVRPPRSPTPLRVLRLQLGLTQHALAEHLGMRQGTVLRWERAGHAGRHDKAIRLAILGLRGVLWRKSMGEISWLTLRAAEERAGQAARPHVGWTNQEKD